MAVTSKFEVACELLNEALRLFLEGKSYFASLNLAGAAEEILGKFIESNGGVPAFKNMRDTAVLFLQRDDDGESAPHGDAQKDIADLINSAKNSTKHGITDVKFDPKEEAQDLIDRAIENYYTLQSQFDLRQIDQLHQYHEIRDRREL
ncbi:hypothetical protein [Caballeronia sp. Lep1P3]|uniref:hypothetical protein n=1 Tax=Caballeronia sp. Lep1P3 TaxID=2878150 RepID=UPI001FD3D198|nr:hypothetical protein [Caballeronia sp. Lep1P3]